MSHLQTANVSMIPFAIQLYAVNNDKAKTKLTQCFIGDIDSQQPSSLFTIYSHTKT